MQSKQGKAELKCPSIFLASARPRRTAVSPADASCTGSWWASVFPRAQAEAVGDAFIRESSIMRICSSERQQNSSWTLYHSSVVINVGMLVLLVCVGAHKVRSHCSPGQLRTCSCPAYLDLHCSRIAARGHAGTDSKAAEVTWGLPLLSWLCWLVWQSRVKPAT